MLECMSWKGETASKHLATLPLTIPIYGDYQQSYHAALTVTWHYQTNCDGTLKNRFFKKVSGLNIKTHDIFASISDRCMGGEKMCWQKKKEKSKKNMRK